MLYGTVKIFFLLWNAVHMIDKNNKLVETLATKKVENGKDIKLTIEIGRAHV